MDEQKKFYISDMHFGHANCLSFDNRPLISVDEMGVELIRRWNSVVSAGDLVYVLGDMFWCKASEVGVMMPYMNYTPSYVRRDHRGV